MNQKVEEENEIKAKPLWTPIWGVCFVSNALIRFYYSELQGFFPMLSIKTLMWDIFVQSLLPLSFVVFFVDRASRSQKPALKKWGTNTINKLVPLLGPFVCAGPACFFIFFIVMPV